MTGTVKTGVLSMLLLALPICGGLTGAPGAVVEGAMAAPCQQDPSGEDLCCGEYRALQTPGEVYIFAEGWHEKSGYKVKLVRSMLEIYPPRYLLGHEKGEGQEGLTPYRVQGSFRATDPIKFVVVVDSKGKHDVRVDPVAAASCGG